MFEVCILRLLEAYLQAHDHQFRLKSRYSTNMCIFSVKSLIKYYTDQNTPAYSCLLCAGKATDRVNHRTLFAKLNKTKHHY